MMNQMQHAAHIALMVARSSLKTKLEDAKRRGVAVVGLEGKLVEMREMPAYRDAFNMLVEEIQNMGLEFHMAVSRVNRRRIDYLHITW